MDKRLRLLRRTLDLTQQEFADRLNIKRNTIANYESGRNEPVGSVFSLICKEFSVNEAWLRNGVGEMFIEKSTFSLDDYADTNKLTDTERQIVRGFMELSPEVRNEIYAIFYNAATPDIHATAPDNPQELEEKFPPVNDADTNVG